MKHPENFLNVLWRKCRTCSWSLFFSLPLIFNVVAASTSHFLTTATKFSCYYSNKKCLLCFSSLALAFCRLLSFFLCLSLDFSFSIFQICGRRWRRQWKRHESELAFFQSSSRLLQVTDFVKCRWTLLKLNKSHIQVQKERGTEFRRHLCTSSVKRKTRHVHVLVVQWYHRNVQKSVTHVQNCWFG